MTDGADKSVRSRRASLWVRRWSVRLLLFGSMLLSVTAGIGWVRAQTHSHGDALRIGVARCGPPPQTVSRVQVSWDRRSLSVSLLRRGRYCPTTGCRQVLGRTVHFDWNSPWPFHSPHHRSSTMHFSWRWGGFSYAGAAYQGADGAAGRSNRSARVPLWFVVSAGVLPAMVRLLLS